MDDEEMKSELLELREIINGIKGGTVEVRFVSWDEMETLLDDIIDELRSRRAANADEQEASQSP